MGNAWITPLSELVLNYRSNGHPICGPIIRGGPAELVEEFGFKPRAGYVDECHLCYLLRKESIVQFPDYLSPKQVYGKNYQSRRIIVADISWPKKEAEDLIARYPVNSNITVWVNPTRPKIAVLERGTVGKLRKYQKVYWVGALFIGVAIITWFIAMFIFR